MPKGSKKAASERNPVSFEIREARGGRVILDADLANIYGVTLRRLRQQYQRNTHRFPPDFAFELTEREIADLNIPSSHIDRNGKHTVRPVAFTEMGAFMIATVLRSEETAATCIFAIRAFVEMRHVLSDTPLHRSKLEELEEGLAGRRDGQIETFEAIFEELKRLLNPAKPQARTIGFVLPKL